MAKPPIVGYYSTGQYVTILDDHKAEELQLLGAFGSKLEGIDRRRPERRGPVDKWLIESKLDGTLALSLSEAFFLLYAFGCLQIVDSDTKETLDIATCWSKFRSSYINSQTDFTDLYAVYHFFRSRDWIIKTGHNYGTHLLLYRDSPSLGHAKYAIFIIEEKNPPAWQTLLTLQRVIQSVCKKLLLAYVRSPSDRDSPSCIKHVRISFRLFNSKLNMNSSG